MAIKWPQSSSNVKSMTWKKKTNWIFLFSSLDTVLHWLACDQPNCLNFTKKRFYWIRGHDISWKRTTHATTWASQKKRIQHLLSIRMRRPIKHPKTVSAQPLFTLFFSKNMFLCVHFTFRSKCIALRLRFGSDLVPIWPIRIFFVLRKRIRKREGVSHTKNIHNDAKKSN